MDYDKYYKKDIDGNYNLHCKTISNLTDDQLKTIFSSYGRVLSFNVTKDENGFKFVKYKTLKETLNCLKGLEDSTEIKILPEKSKINRVDKRDSSQQQAGRSGNSFKKASNDKPLNSNSIHSKSLSNAESLTRIRISDENNESDFSKNFMHGHKFNQSLTKDNELDSAKFDKKSSLPSRQTFMKNERSDTTVDYEKYYKITKDGTYSVHFVNKKGLSSEEIKDIFSCYGDVLSIRGREENDNGLKFITYATKEEVIRCLKGLQNSNVITILPQKDKLEQLSETKATDKKSSNQWQSTRTEDISQRTNNDKQFNSNLSYNEKFSGNGEKLTHNAKTFDWDKFEDNISGTDYVSRQNYKSNENINKHKNIDLFNEKYSFSRQKNPINEYDQERKTMRKKQESKFYPSRKTETDTEMNGDLTISTHDYKIPALISEEIKPKESDTVSDGSLSNGTKNFSSRFNFIPMQELIVANIHMNYGIHYILHLFEKYSPISATLIKTNEKTNVRYCHVYFKTIQDADAVEEEFDNFNLSGKNLIVLRKSRLIDETL
ncbi:uncharacterized protein LOC105840269 [Monomorium pharaonis]|uniref:uncharacterized protein LOC105840269 n=1 Tax=Monomorium pharaonis TaxID=307658 RepID=UPI00063F893E|nr:uncharacterized protein LOC105840269 [Monomorium pharaonis]XP_012542611.1 uncharacterized protein LOC105840269 [Monomorium pharaonis]